MNEREFEILKHMSDLKVDGFPKVFSKGITQHMPYIIMQRLGPNVYDLLKQRGKLFSMKCLMTIGIQLVNLFEKLHQQGFIHNDLKPNNVLIGKIRRNNPDS